MKLSHRVDTSLTDEYKPQSEYTSKDGCQSGLAPKSESEDLANLVKDNQRGQQRI